MHDIDQLVQQLKQDGHVQFQLLSPDAAAHLNGLVHGTACTQWYFMLVLLSANKAVYRS